MFGRHKKQQIKTVAYLGWTGHGNLGDSIILEGFRQLFKGWKIIVMSDDEHSTFPKVNFKEVNKCDLFVLGGGELINADRLFFGVNWAHKIKIPKIILGCGVNAKRTGDLTKDVVSDLEQFSYIGLRDNVAVGILKSIPSLESKVELFHDLAFSINIEGLSKKPKRDLAVVMPTDRFSDRDDKGIRMFNVAHNSEEWLTMKLKPYDSTIFLPFGQVDNDDFKTCLSLSPCGNHSVVLRPEDVSLDNVLGLLSSCSVAFPYRLHGLILSFLLGVPFELYPYHHKLTRVYETIKDCYPNEIKIKQKEIFNEITNSIF